MAEEKDDMEGISIGALSKATGISIHSLRMWERRYGAPESLRRLSGHRRYRFEEVSRLRAVARALAAGFRAGEVVAATIEQIDAMLEKAARPGRRSVAAAREIETNSALNEKIKGWVKAATRFDEQFLTTEFHEAWAKLGPMGFIQDRAVPFMKGIGDGWQCGSVAICQEHFAAERLGDFIAGKWRQRNETATGDPFLLATLPRDAHRLGLQMCAMAVALSGMRIVYLGTQIPLDEVIDAAAGSNCTTVCISMSSVIPARYAVRHLETLRQRIDQKVHILCGGAGAPPPPEGVRRYTGLPEFMEWIQATYNPGSRG